MQAIARIQLKDKLVVNVASMPHHHVDGKAKNKEDWQPNEAVDLQIVK